MPYISVNPYLEKYSSHEQEKGNGQHHVNDNADKVQTQDINIATQKRLLTRLCCFARGFKGNLLRYGKSSSCLRGSTVQLLATC